MTAFAKVMLLVAMVSVGTAAFYWDDLVSLYHNKTSKPISIADSICAPLWVARAQNDPALACYLQQKTERLCSADERAHLSWIFKRYEADKKASGEDMLVAVMSFALTTNKQAMADKMKANGTAAAMEVDTLPRRKLVAMVQAIAKQGLVIKSDFGWTAPPLVRDAFDGKEELAVGTRRSCV